MLGISIRQIKRNLRAYREEGAQGLVSKRRGRENNNRRGKAVKQKVLDLLWEKYRGFGPMLAGEKLVEVERLKISDESKRQMMISEGLWKSRKARKRITHPVRERRVCCGEQVQIDGSPHD